MFAKGWFGFSFAILALSLAGCIEHPENGGAYGGVADDTDYKNFKDISAELLGLSSDTNKVQFSCQNKDGSKGLNLERAAVDHIEHYFERQNGLLVELDTQPIRSYTERDNPGPMYFTGLQLNGKGFAQYDSRFGFFLRISRDQPIPGSTFIASSLHIDQPNLTIFEPEFYCLPVDVRVQDELRTMSTTPDANGKTVGTVFQMRGLESQALYSMLLTNGAKDTEVAGRLPEPFPGVISRGGVTCAPKTYIDKLDAKSLQDSYNCAFVVDATATQVVPTGDQWNPLISMIGYGEAVIRQEILASSPLRNGAPGFAYKSMIRGLSVGDDVVTWLNPGDTTEMKLRMKGVSEYFTYNQLLYPYKFAHQEKAFPAIDSRGTYFELRAPSSQIVCRKFQTSEDDKWNMNYECDVTIGSDGKLRTLP